MNPKKFKLPKEFAEKWIKALESGEYKQGHSMLATTDLGWEEEGVPPLEVCNFCCLGVAAEISGNSIEKLIGVEYLYSKKAFIGVPEELITTESGIDNTLVWAVSQLNDGINYGTYLEEFKTEGYTFRIDVEQHFAEVDDTFQLNFNQIIEFIQDNVEFY